MIAGSEKDDTEMYQSWVKDDTFWWFREVKSKRKCPCFFLCTCLKIVDFLPLFPVGKDEVPGSNPGISSRKTSQKWLVFCYINTCSGRFEALWSESEGPRFLFQPYLSIFMSVFSWIFPRKALIFLGFQHFVSVRNLSVHTDLLPAERYFCLRSFPSHNASRS